MSLIEEPSVGLSSIVEGRRRSSEPPDLHFLMDSDQLRRTWRPGCGFRAAEASTKSFVPGIVAHASHVSSTSPCGRPCNQSYSRHRCPRRVSTSSAVVRPDQQKTLTFSGLLYTSAGACSNIPGLQHTARVVLAVAFLSANLNGVLNAAMGHQCFSCCRFHVHNP